MVQATCNNKHQTETTLRYNKWNGLEESSKKDKNTFPFFIACYFNKNLKSFISRICWQVKKTHTSHIVEQWKQTYVFNVIKLVLPSKATCKTNLVWMHCMNKSPNIYWKALWKAKASYCYWFIAITSHSKLVLML